MRWSLRRKLLAGFGLLLLLTALIVAWSILSIERLGSASNAILRENYRSILAMDEMRNALDLQDRAALIALLGRVGDGRAEYAAQTAPFYEWYGRELDNITVSGEGQLARDLGSAYADFQAAFSRFFELAQSNPPAARTYYAATVRPLRDKVRGYLTALKNLNQTAMYSASARAARIASSAVLSVLFVGIILLIVGGAFSVFVSLIILRPITRLIAATANIAEGSYELQIEPRSRDELGALTRSFNAMVKRIKESFDNRMAEVIAESRKSEAIVESLEDGIIVLDRDLKVVLANLAAKEFLGAPRGFRDHPHLLEVLNNEAVYGVARAALEKPETEGRDATEELVEIEREGIMNVYQVAINPIRSDASSTTGIVLLLRDVTRLKAVDRMKSEFVMTASHELKTPLTGIGMSIALLKESLEGRLTPRENELFDAAGEDTARLVSIVHDLLDLSRIEAGQMTLDLQNAPASLILTRACESLKLQAEEKGIELSCAGVDPACAVYADVTKTTWVVTNLIANALRHTPRGGRIRCAAIRYGDWVHFSVSDNGSGIPLEEQSRIFEKFARVVGETDGTGLGLAICREIVRASGGTIWVDSEPGKGSTFTFTAQIAHAVART